MKLKKKYVITLVIIGALLCSGFTYNAFKKRVRYHTRPLKKCTITQVVEASGTINPVNTVSVGSTVSGLIQDIYVDFNSQVKKGQILARIDPRTFEATVQQNQAQIANAQANVARLKAVVDYDKVMYERYKNLYAKNFVAKSELDQYRSTYYSDLAQMQAAQAQVRQYQANLKTAQTNLGYTEIIAPVDGTIVSREIDVGQPVAASFQAPQLFTIAQDLTKMQIEVSVSEADIGKVQDGQDVTYTLDGYPDSLFHGKVTQVRISPTTVSNVVTYTVIVNVNNDDLKLIPGMTANVSIITDKSEDVMCAPSIALKFNPNTDGTRYKTQGIWILEKRKPKRINIETGASDDTNTEIISKDLKEGDRVIVDSSLTSSKDKTNQRRRGPRMF